MDGKSTPSGSNPMLNFKNPTLAISQTSHFPKPKRKDRNKVDVFGKSVCKRRRKYEVSRTKLMDLPRAIMVEIFSRLPIRSIFRVKMVCKSLYTVFSDPLFVNLYHTRFPFPCILFSPDMYSILELKADYDYDSCPNNRPIVLNNSLPQLTMQLVPFMAQYSRLIGSCYGFICILVSGISFENQFVYICNPLLGEYVKLNVPKWEKRNLGVVYGFCSSQASGPYKVLRSVLKRHGHPQVSQLEVYTVGVDEEWRILGEGPFRRWGPFSDVIVNGALHWMDVKDTHSMPSIYSFDIETEKVKSLPAPPGLETPSSYLSLTKLGDILCLSDSCKWEHLDIWWMKEYGVSESWVKDRISMSSISPEILLYICKPIMIWKDGEILMQNDPQTKDLVSYNPKEKKFRKVNVHGGDARATTYVPSFYSLKTVVGDRLEISKVYPRWR